MTQENHSSDSDHDAPTGHHATARPVSTALNLDELVNRCMGNLGLVHRVLLMFQQRFPEELEEIAKALERGDADRLARVAHRAKGTSASVSAHGLARRAGEIEELCRAGAIEHTAAEIERLRVDWENCRKETAELLAADGVA